MADDLRLDQRLDEADAIDLQYYFQLLQTAVEKYYKPIILLVVVSVAVAYYKTSSVTPTYTASTTLHLTESSKSGFWNNDGNYWGGGATFQSTQFGIIKSRLMMSRVATALEMEAMDEPTESPPVVLETAMDRALRFVGLMPNPAPGPEMRAHYSSSAIAGAVSVARSSGQESSNLITISATWPDPDGAARVANAVASNYIELLFEKDLDHALKSQRFLTERLASLREEIRVAEEEYQLYLEQEDILSPTTGPGEVDTEFTSVSTRLSAARDERLRAEALYDQVKDLRQRGTDPVKIPAIANHPQIRRLTDSLMSIEAKIRELDDRYGPKHDKMIALASEAASVKSSINLQVQNVVESLRSDYQLAVKNEKAREETVDTARNRKQSRGRKEFKLKELQQEVATKQDVYAAFLERLNQGGPADAVENNNVWIVDEAIAPGSANSPLTERYVLLALVLSLAGGLGAGVLRELIRTSITSDEEVERNLGVKCLGIVPLVTMDRSESTVKVENDKVPMMFDSPTGSPYFVEAMGSLRTTLTLLSGGEGCRRYLITSSDPAEGKSTLTLSLGASFAQMKRVLVIDCDLRRPSLDRILDGNSGRRRLGLTDLMAGDVPMEECIYQVEGSTMDLLPAGSRTLKPLELLSSAEFTKVLNRLSDQYDVILIDTPPCLVVSDAIVLASQVDSIVFVVKAAVTKVSTIRRALKRLTSFDSPVAGVLLNQLDLEAPYYHGHYTDYHYYQEYQKGPAVQSG